MSKNVSAKYYQKTKERLQKKAQERYQNVSNKETKKNNNIVVNVTKISQKMKKWTNWIEKYYKNRIKGFIIIIRECFDLKRFASLLGKV